MLFGAIRTRGNLRSLNSLQQHIYKMWPIQKKYQHHIAAEEHYQEVSVNQNTKEFPYNSLIEPLSVATEEEQLKFKSFWPEISETFVNAFADFPELKEHYKKLLEDNVTTNKQNSGILVLTSYKMFEDPEKITTENIKLASILGWCVNMNLSLFMITDDIIDGAVMRFGKPSWYKRNNVGMTAINDANLMQNGIYVILKKYFSQHHSYFPAADLFNNVIMKTAIGQALDTMAYGLNKRPLLTLFTMDNYKRIAKHKGTYPEYILPVMLGMYLAGKYDPKLHRMVKDFLLDLGLYFTAQNDILDCYGDPAILGKDGTDIREGKCTWLAVEALKRGTSAQNIILRNHYGRSQDKSEVIIRSLFNDLRLLDYFLIYEKNSFNAARQIIHQMPEDPNKEFFVKNAEATYNKKV